MGLSIFVNNAKKLLNVFDTPLSIIGANSAIGINYSRLIHDHLNYFAKITFVGLGFMDERHKFTNSTTSIGTNCFIGNTKFSCLQKGTFCLARYIINMLDRGTTNATLRRIDNAACCNIICRIDHQTQIRHNISNFRTIKEASSPH